MSIMQREDMSAKSVGLRVLSRTVVVRSCIDRGDIADEHHASRCNVFRSPQNGDFIRTALARVNELLSEMSSVQLVLVMWSLATLRHSPSPRVLDSMATAYLAKHDDQTQPQNLSIMLWSVARLGANPLGGTLVQTIIQMV